MLVEVSVNPFFSLKKLIRTRRRVFFLIFLMRRGSQLFSFEVKRNKKRENGKIELLGFTH